jgi:hypothetical protein
VFLRPFSSENAILAQIHYSLFVKLARCVLWGRFSALMSYITAN